MNEFFDKLCNVKQCLKAELTQVDHLMTAENILDFNMKLSSFLHVNLVFDNPKGKTKRHVIPHEGQDELFAGNFRLEIDSKYQLRDVLKHVELEIRGNQINMLYPEAFGSMFMCQNNTEAQSQSERRTVYFLPGIKYLSLGKCYETAFNFRFQNDFEGDVKFIYEYYDDPVPKTNNVPETAFDCRLIPFYQTQLTYHNLRLSNEYLILFNHKLLSLEIELKINNHYHKKLSDYFNGLCLVFKDNNDEVQVHIDNNLLKQFEEHFGNGIIPLVNHFNFKDQLMNGINMSKVDCFYLRTFPKAGTGTGTGAEMESPEIKIFGTNINFIPDQIVPTLYSI